MMNKQGPKGIGWCDYTWSPVTGCLGPNGSPCPYCYARGIARRFGKTEAERNFKPIFHPERLAEVANLRKPSRIFVCSMADLFGDWVPPEQITLTLDAAFRVPRHIYLFLTRNPRGAMGHRAFLENEWIGVTVTSQLDADERIPLLLSVPAAHRFISFEPLLSGVDLGDHVCGVDWAVIGAMTGHMARPTEPGAGLRLRQWVTDLTAQCDASNVPVYHKSSLERYGFNRRDIP